MYNEATVTINGFILNEEQSQQLRIAIECWHSMKSNSGVTYQGQKEDMDRLTQVRQFFYNTQQQD